MDNRELKQNLIFLESISSDFYIQEMSESGARNKTKKNEYKRQMDNIILRFKSYVLDRPELFNLLTSEMGTPIDRMFQWDEIIKPWQFSGELSKRLEWIKAKIDEEK